MHINLVVKRHMTYSSGSVCILAHINDAGQLIVQLRYYNSFKDA